MLLSCCSFLIYSERIKSRRGRLNVPGLTDSFLLEPTSCVQRCQTVNFAAKWTLEENNTLTDLQMPSSFCSAYFPRCIFSVPLRIILLSFSNIHTLIILHLHYSNYLIIFSSVAYLPPHLHDDASLFFVTHLWRLFAKFPSPQKKIVWFVMSARLSVRMEQLASHWTTFMKFYISEFFENLSIKFRVHYNITEITRYCP
jgi:hypothetical protein